MKKPAKLVDGSRTSDFRRDGDDGGGYARRMVSEIKSQWLRGAPADAQGVLAQHPELGSDKSAVLDLAYEEYCLRRQAGTSPDPDEFCRRFPHYKTSLRRLIEAHHCLEALAPAEGDAAASWPEVGDSFLGFTLRRELGRGAFARVFLANDTELGDKWVVVKVSRDGAAEAALLGRLDGHPNVVPVLAVKCEELSGWTAVVMPYLGSATLCDVIDHAFAGPGPPRDARVILAAAQRPGRTGAAPHRLLRRGTYIDGVLHLAVQLADGLSFVHARGVCHGDLKPSNILLTPDGRPMLVDFNLAYDPRQSGRRLGGTLPYVAPEQLGTASRDAGPAPLDVRSDLFAFGVILYELLTGAHPFGPVPVRAPLAEVRALLLERQRGGPRPLHQLNRHVPRRLARVVGQCLAFAPAARPESLSQVATALRRETGRFRVARRRVGRHPVLALGTALALVGGLAGPAAWDAYRTWPRPDRARTHLDAFQYPAAITELNRILAHDPTNRPARLLRARELQYLNTAEGRKQADADFAELERLDPANGVVKACRGYWVNVQGRTKEALVCYQDAVQSGFTSAEVENNIGYCHLMLGHPDEAQRILNRVIDRGARLQAVYYNRAFLVLKYEEMRDQLPQALGDIETAVRLGPKVTGLLCRHAAALYAVAAESDPHAAERALHFLGQAVRLGQDPRQLRDDSYFQVLRGHRRFADLLRQPPVPAPVDVNLQLADPLPPDAQFLK